MAVFKNIFTWWEGATFGTWLGTRAGGVAVGEDSDGNQYYEAKRSANGFKRRWIIYAGANDASRIPPEWHSWIHHTIDDVPDRALPAARAWQAQPTPNLTGTEAAYIPAGAQGSGKGRAVASGDYEAWTPDAS